MYETRQHKDKVSRTLSIGNHVNTKPLQMKENKQYSIFTNGNIIQRNPWDILSGLASIVGGGVSMITGGRDSFNAYRDYKHTIYNVQNSNLIITNANGTLELIDNNNLSLFKVKVVGDVDAASSIVGVNRNDARSRIVEGALNSASGVLNIGAGIASLLGGGWPLVMYALSSLVSATAAGGRFIRSRR